MTKYSGQVFELVGLYEPIIEMHGDVACGITIITTMIKVSKVNPSDQ